MKILSVILEAIFSPFSLIVKTDNFINANKPIKNYIILIASIIIVTGIVLLVYRHVIFG